MLLFRRPFAFLLILFGVSSCLRSDLSAQVRPVNDYGAIGLTQQLRRLNTTASVMMIGAHPDDEDSSLLAYLARGENARTAYLSLTRGDGGQNVIGPELFEPLGIIRTEELLQARRLDGAEQYFARAFDFGFSKTVDEARSKWPEDVIKCDVVRAIRAFKPLVVISRFSGTPADGHGQHQFAGYISPIAVKAAGDWNQCKDAGPPWIVKKFYRSQGFSSTDQAALQLNAGKFDTLYGRSYFEMAIEGRSQHKSQGEGRIELKGDQYSGLRLQDVSTIPAEKSPFDGIDTSIEGIPTIANSSESPFNSRIPALAAAIKAVAAKYRSDAANDIVNDLAGIYRLARDAEWSTRRPESKQYMREIQSEAAAAIRLAAGIQIDLLSDKETVTPGGEISAWLRAYAATDKVLLEKPKIETSNDFFAFETVPPPANQQTGPLRREQGKINILYKINVKKEAAITEPYWLASPRRGELFEWSGEDLTLPFARQQVKATLIAKIGDVEIPLTQPLEYRYADLSRGELRRDVHVVPPVSVSLDREVVIAPNNSTSIERTIIARVSNNTAQPLSAKVTARVPDESALTVDVSPSSVELKANESANVELSLKIVGRSKTVSSPVLVEAIVGGASYRRKMHIVAYPHIQTHRYYTDSTANVVSFDLKAASRNIGYIMGSGDEVPEAIRQIGMPVTMLEEKDLASGDLAKYDTIVVGVRATETRPDMMANKAQLLEYAKNGGNLIIQYQRGQFANSGLPPFPVTTANTERTAAGAISRVVDENAKVTILVPGHPFFTTPNVITNKDFEGWVQERNAYNLVTFDPQFTGLLESHDAGEKESNGGLVTAKLGKGTWTYCSYSFFRQLPAGVPGAYRLFANMLSQPRGK